MAQAEVDESGSDTLVTSAEKKELAQLRRDKRRLELEVDILKRAAAYFARESRNVTVQRRNQLWITDITERPTNEGRSTARR